MVNQKFYGRTFMRSVLLFPYVAPVVALAYTWELLLDPTSGTLNSLLINYQIVETPINLLGQKYVEINILGFDFKLIDTAGIRKKSKINDDIEFYSVVRSIRTIENSDVCLILFDATRSFDTQVKNIFWLCERNKKGIVLIFDSFGPP